MCEIEIGNSRILRRTPCGGNKSKFSNVQNSKRDSSSFGCAGDKLRSFRMTSMWIPVPRSESRTSFTGMIAPEKYGGKYWGVVVPTTAKQKSWVKFSADMERDRPTGQALRLRSGQAWGPTETVGLQKLVIFAIFPAVDKA